MNHLPQTSPAATAMVGSSSQAPSNDGRPAYPYPGLRPFQQDESAIFFGRGEQIGEMLTRLENHRFLAVVGASGCGKSSLVRAGLLPALDQGFLAAASEQWRFVIIRPGDAPLRNLASELARTLGPQSAPDESTDVAEQADPHRVAMIRAGLRSGPKGLVQVVDDARLAVDTNVLVLVDQFEELFRFRHRNKSLDDQSDAPAAAAERDEAAALVSLLLATAAQRDRPIYAVITMRSDFLGDCDAFYGLPEAINDSQFLTPRMTRDQARDAIVEPARLFGGDVEPALANRILNEIGNDPDQLPLMQHALMRAWRHAEKERGRPVTIQLADYQRLGGLQKALSNHADYVLEHLDSDADRRVAEMLFRALCDRSAEQRLTRRLATVAEIAAIAGVDADDVIRVANAFRGSGRNFLTPPSEIPLTSDSTLDISHESLIRQWATLQTWLAREEQSARIYRRLSETTRLFKANQAGFYRPPDLDVALEWKEYERPTAAWAKRYDASFESSMQFLETSRAEEEQRKNEEHDRKVRELAAAKNLANEQEARARMFRRMAKIIGIVAIGAIALFLWALWAQSRARIAESDAIRYEQLANDRYKDARDALDTVLFAVKDDLKDLPNVQEVRARLLKELVTKYERFAKEHSEPSYLDRESVQARTILAEMLFELGDMEGCEKAARESLQQIDVLLTQTPNSTTYQLLAADTYFVLGRCLTNQEKKDEARNALVTAIASYHTLARESKTGDDHYVLSAAKSRLKLAAAFEDVGNAQSGLQETVRAIEELESLGVTESSERERERDALLADAYQSLGWKYLFLRDYGQARSNFANSLAGIQELQLFDPGNLKYWAESAEAKVGLAISMNAVGHSDSAEVYFRDASQEIGTLARVFPTVAHYGKFQGQVAMYYAAFLASSGREAEANTQFTYAIKQLRGLVDRVPEGNVYAYFYLAYSRMLLGNMIATKEGGGEAKDLIELAIEHLRQLREKNYNNQYFATALSMALASRAIHYKSDGDYDKALQHLDQAIALAEEVFYKNRAVHDHLVDVGGVNSMPLWEALLVRGEILLETGQFPEVFVTATRLSSVHGKRPEPSYAAAKLFALLAGHPGAEATVVQSSIANALRSLEQAQEKGFSEIQQLEADHEFESLRDTPEFQRIIRKMRSDDASDEVTHEKGGGY